MCTFISDARQDVLVISDNRYFLLGLQHYYQNDGQKTVKISSFSGLELDDYHLRFSIATILDRVPRSVRLVLSFHDDRVMRCWVCELRRLGRRFLNMVETPDGREFAGKMAFLLLSSRMTLAVFDSWLERQILPPVMGRYSDSFRIVDMILAGKRMKQIAFNTGIIEKTLYNRLRGLNIILDLAGLNALYWMRLIRLCADYDAIYPDPISAPKRKLMYQASLVG